MHAVLRRRGTGDEPVGLQPGVDTAARRAADPLCVRYGGGMRPAPPGAIHPAPFCVPACTLKILFHARHAGIPGRGGMPEQLLAAACEAPG